MALTKEQIKEFKAAEKEAEGQEVRGVIFFDLKYVADSMVDAGDKKWAKEIYKKAEGKAQDCSEFMELAESITGYLVDKEWAKKIYKKAEKKAEEIFEINELANSIYEKFNDKEWVKKIYKEVEKKAETSSEFSDLAYRIEENIGDKDWAKKVCKKTEDKTEGINEDNNDEDEEKVRQITIHGLVK